MEKQYLRIEEVCEIVGVSKATVYRMIKEDGFPAPTKIGKRKSRWHAQTLREWIDDQETAKWDEYLSNISSR